MDEQLYAEFLAERRLGLKARSKVTLQKFISSFESFSEKQAWTDEFLNTVKPDERVRHELYESVVFPVLIAGADRILPIFFA